MKIGVKNRYFQNEHPHRPKGKTVKTGSDTQQTICHAPQNSHPYVGYISSFVRYAEFQPFLRFPVITNRPHAQSLSELGSDTRHIKKQITDGRTKNRRLSACTSFCFVNSLTGIHSFIYGKLRKSIFFSKKLHYFYTNKKSA